ncbi:hypothetical protein OF83DRAFT_1085954 [Amylostereum chailletii]|nr:hypothetical protein OF83DRAFT_1085954 [Amylostereum chailletii]
MAPGKAARLVKEGRTREAYKHAMQKALAHTLPSWYSIVHGERTRGFADRHGQVDVGRHRLGLRRNPRQGGAHMLGLGGLSAPAGKVLPFFMIYTARFCTEISLRADEGAGVEGNKAASVAGGEGVVVEGAAGSTAMEALKEATGVDGSANKGKGVDGDGYKASEGVDGDGGIVVEGDGKVDNDNDGD